MIPRIRRSRAPYIWLFGIGMTRMESPVVDSWGYQRMKIGNNFGHRTSYNNITSSSLERHCHVSKNTAYAYLQRYVSVSDYLNSIRNHLRQPVEQQYGPFVEGNDLPISYWCYWSYTSPSSLEYDWFSFAFPCTPTQATFAACSLPQCPVCIKMMLKV